MTIVTIPHSQRSLPHGEYVLVPKLEYEELLSIRKTIRVVKPTTADLRQVARADREIKAGKYYSLKQVRNELEHLHHRDR